MAPADIVVSVDPGLTGGVAFLEGTRLLAVHSMPIIRDGRGKGKPDGAALAALIRTAGAVRAVVELVGSRPGEGHVGVFSFGKGAGIVEGVLRALGLPMVEVEPATWKQALRCPADKTKARTKASGIFPGHAGQWKRVKDDGRAEAALIGYWLATCAGRPPAPRGSGPIEW